MRRLCPVSIWIFLVFFAVSNLSVELSAQSTVKGSMHGSYKSFSRGLYDAYYQGDLYGLSDNKLRLDTALHMGQSLSLNLNYILTPLIGSSNELSQTPANGLAGGESGYRIYEPDRRLYPLHDADVENAALFHNIDRANAALYLPFGDLYIGRQAISWGSARVLNPTDIIAPYSFNSFDTEDKPGVDALRLRVPIGMMNEADIAYVAGEDFDAAESAFFIRSKLYLAQTDVSLLAMDFKENLLTGIDLSRSIGGAGAWLETASVIPEVFSTEGPDTKGRYLRLSAGADYNFSSHFYGYTEYHYNGVGESEAAAYPTQSDILSAPDTHTAYSEGSVYLLGRHYLSLGGTYTPMPLLPVSGLAMLNLVDLSFSVSLSFEYNFKEGVYVVGGLSLGVGDAPETEGSATGIRITEYNSEFGAAPALFYSGVKIYF